MSTSARPLRVRPYPSGPYPDDARADRIRSLWHAVADWPVQVAGDSVEGPLWAAILWRRVALEDEHGFRSVSTFRTPDDARAFFDNVAAYVAPLLRTDDDGGPA